jgi:hypothetical protein
MDFDAKKPVKNPYKHANPVSKVFFLSRRVIKMYAWEKPFSEVIDKIRSFVSNSRLQYKYLIPCSLYIQLSILSLRLEVKVLRKRSYLRGDYL